MTREDFKIELTLRLLDSIILEKNIGTKEDPVFELDAKNTINYLKLIRKIAEYTFGDDE